MVCFHMYAFNGTRICRIDTDRFHRPLALLPRDAENAEGGLFLNNLTGLTGYTGFFGFSPIRKID